MKAILVVDIPGNYQQFGSGDWYIEGDCLRIGYKDKYGWFNGWKIVKNNMIALKPMPSKLPSADIMKAMSIQSGINLPRPLYTEEYEKGYNDCIREILGEEE